MFQVTMEKRGPDLYICADEECRKAIQEAKDEGINIDSDLFTFEVLERPLCNGWEAINPKEVGALTDGLIITDDCSRDDMNNLTHCGRVYWHERYQVESIGGELLECGEVRLLGRD